MNSYIDFYLGMGNGWLHIFELLILVSICIFINIKIKKMENMEQKIYFYSKVKYILFSFSIMIIMVNLYLTFEIFNSQFYLDIPLTEEGIVEFFNGFKQMLYPFLLSQMIVSLLAIIFYSWIYIKYRLILRKYIESKMKL